MKATDARRKSARHEACHIFLADKFQFPIERTSVIGLGETLIDMTSPAAAAAEYRQDGEQWTYQQVIATCVAPGLDEMSDADLATLLTYEATFPGAPQVWERFVKRAVTRAEEVLAFNERALDYFAVVLAMRGTLEGRELRQQISHARTCLTGYGKQFGCFCQVWFPDVVGSQD